MTLGSNFSLLIIYLGVRRIRGESDSSLLENGPWVLVEEAFRYRFSNRHPQNRDHWLGSRIPGYPAGAFEAATLTQACNLFGTGWYFQPIPKSFPRLSQISFLFVYSLRIAMRTRSSYTVLYVHQLC